MPSNRSASFSIRQAVSYSLLGAVSTFAHIPVIQVSSFAVSVLATRYGFDLVALGLALALVTVSDAIWDPLIGASSDRWQLPWGRRRAWIALGVPLTAVSGLFLYYPREAMTIASFALPVRGFQPVRIAVPGALRGLGDRRDARRAVT